MRTRGRRRKYDREFKLEAVRLVTEGGRKATEVGRDLGIHPNLLYSWKGQLAENQDHAAKVLRTFPGQGNLKPDAEEMRQLKRKLADVEEEREILKKVQRILGPWPFSQGHPDEVSVY